MPKFKKERTSKKTKENERDNIKVNGSRDVSADAGVSEGMIVTPWMDGQLAIRKKLHHITIDGEQYVPATYVYGTSGKYMDLPERPRYLECSDGQILDRLSGDEPRLHYFEMNRCNEAQYGFRSVKIKQGG